MKLVVNSFFLEWSLNGPSKKYLIEAYYVNILFLKVLQQNKNYKILFFLV